MNFDNRITNTSIKLESQSGFLEQLSSHCVAIEVASIQASLDIEINDNAVNSFDKDRPKFSGRVLYLYIW